MNKGIGAVRAHLAKLPPPESLTFAGLPAQYERAERAFPTPPEVTIERRSVPTAPAERLTPPDARDDPMLDDGQAAIDRIGEFVRGRTG